jgi:hypothetical protein
MLLNLLLNYQQVPLDQKNPKSIHNEDQQQLNDQPPLFQIIMPHQLQISELLEPSFDPI